MGYRLVWRVEDCSERGMYYVAGSVLREWLEVHPSSDTNTFSPACAHPGPSADKRLRTTWRELQDSEAFFFGFASLRHARAWLFCSGLCADLASWGLQLSRYRVPASDVLDGTKQCVFRKRTAQFVNARPLSVLHD